MSEQFQYQPNAGQTYMPFQENTKIKTLPYTPLPRPNPPIPELVLNQMAREKKWELQSQCQHFLPGVTAKMLRFQKQTERSACYNRWSGKPYNSGRSCKETRKIC